MSFEVESLERVERLYRSRLTTEPADMIARVSLAWCLFMQALHRAGQESMLREIVAAGAAVEPGRGAPAPACSGARSDDLLRDCLRQAIAVTQLSSAPEARDDVERLHTLVKLSGGDRALSEASEEAARILMDVTREILGSADGDPRQPRRLPRSLPEA